MMASRFQLVHIRQNGLLSHFYRLQRCCCGRSTIPNAAASAKLVGCSRQLRVVATGLGFAGTIPGWLYGVAVRTL